jgi:ribonuclease HI
MGPVKRFLGMDIIRPDLHTIYVSHRNYAQRILAKFSMQDCNPVKTPFESQSVLSKTADGDEPIDSEEYRSITGSIMHLAVYTRPDIMFAASKLAQFNSNPSMQHYRAAKHLLRYIQGTKDFVLTFMHTDNLAPLGYCDASFAADPDDRKSTSGYIFFLANGPISWQSNKQTTVALSTMEAEYIALTEAAKEAKFLRHLLSTISKPVLGPTLIKTDSQAALEHVKNNIRHARTKHIDTRHHFIRNVYTAREIDIEHVPSHVQAADVLTKALGKVKHEESFPLMNLSPLPSEMAKCD